MLKCYGTSVLTLYKSVKATVPFSETCSSSCKIFWLPLSVGFWMLVSPLIFLNGIALCRDFVP